MPKLMTVIASTRPGRVGPAIADWFVQQAVQHGAFDLEVVDLAQLALPLLDEPNHPRLRRYTKPHTLQWSASVDATDAFAFVTAEYNHGYPAALKNAIDYLNNEWHYKPVGFVSYGGVAAGTRAVQQLKQVVTAVRLTPIVEAVNIPFVGQLIDAEGILVPNDVMQRAAADMLDELARVAAALRPLRSVEPHSVMPEV
jgi:NAD(P)H-dependent FMN reductase